MAFKRPRPHISVSASNLLVLKSVVQKTFGLSALYGSAKFRLLLVSDHLVSLFSCGKLVMCV